MNNESQENSLTRQIDELYAGVKHYRNSKEFRNYLEFCVTFKKYSMFNCMLIHLQKPGARFVLPENKWEKEFDRVIKSDARPIIILQPFGPVMLVYDVYQTVSNESNSLFGTDDDKINSYLEMFRNNKSGNIAYKDCLVNNLPFHGVLYSRMTAGGDYEGKLEVAGKDEPNITVEEKLQKDAEPSALTMTPAYTLKTNNTLSPIQEFSVIIHELGHMFCHHLPADIFQNWPYRRSLSYEVVEFEAETVAWLVSQRHGVTPPSTKYLSFYLENDGEIPPININEITFAVDTIEKMFQKQKVQECTYCRNVPQFKIHLREMGNHH